MSKVIDGHKHCNKCENLLPITEFSSRITVKSGLNGRCKDCIKSINDITNERYKEKRKNDEEYRLKEKETRRKKHDRRCETDPFYKFKRRVQGNLSVLFRKMGFRRSHTCREILGADWDIIKEYFESKFKDGMGWENYGYYGWHIDHIIPLSSAKTEKEVYELSHYTNLQPLWAKDNVIKSDKIIIDFISEENKVRYKKFLEMDMSEHDPLV